MGDGGRVYDGILLGIVGVLFEVGGLGWGDYIGLVWNLGGD